MIVAAVAAAAEEAGNNTNTTSRHHQQHQLLLFSATTTYSVVLDRRWMASHVCRYWLCKYFSTGGVVHEQLSSRFSAVVSYESNISAIIVLSHRYWYIENEYMMFIVRRDMVLCTQLFYSQQFYNQTVLVTNMTQLEQFCAYKMVKLLFINYYQYQCK
jgi:hypothetical protein